VPLVVPPSFAHPRLMAGTGAKALRYPDPLTGVWRHTLLGFGVQLRSHVPYRPADRLPPIRLALRRTVATPAPSSLAPL
jgi:hypothetical protein